MIDHGWTRDEIFSFLGVTSSPQILNTPISGQLGKRSYSQVVQEESQPVPQGTGLPPPRKKRKKGSKTVNFQPVGKTEPTAVANVTIVKVGSRLQELEGKTRISEKEIRLSASTWMPVERFTFTDKDGVNHDTQSGGPLRVLYKLSQLHSKPGSKATKRYLDFHFEGDTRRLEATILVLLQWCGHRTLMGTAKALKFVQSLSFLKLDEVTQEQLRASFQVLCDAYKPTLPTDFDVESVCQTLGSEELVELFHHHQMMVGFMGELALLQTAQGRKRAARKQSNQSGSLNETDMTLSD